MKEAGEELRLALCRIFGEPAKQTTGITITIEAPGNATVTVTRLMTDLEAAKMVTVLRYFGLVLKDEQKIHLPIFGADAAVPPELVNITELARQALHQTEEA